MTLVLVKPKGCRKLWRVESRNGAGRVLGYWACDSEDIARELLRRVKAGKRPGWVSHDLRHSRGK